MTRIKCSLKPIWFVCRTVDGDETFWISPEDQNFVNDRDWVKIDGHIFCDGDDYWGGHELFIIIARRMDFPYTIITPIDGDYTNCRRNNISKEE